MINDLQVDCVDLWKYVDDTAIAETVPKNHSSNIQAALDGLVRKTHIYLGSLSVLTPILAKFYVFI